MKYVVDSCLPAKSHCQVQLSRRYNVTAYLSVLKYKRALSQVRRFCPSFAAAKAQLRVLIEIETNFGRIVFLLFFFN